MKRRANNDQNPTEERVSDNCFISKLPSQILDDICFRLPIKDVVRCKAVCTNWNKLLSNPRFSEEYAKFSRFTSVLQCLDRSIVPPVPRVLDLVEFSDNGDSIRSSIVLKLPHRLQRARSGFVGSCNGLVCILLREGISRVIYVTNPILGYGVELPRNYTIPEGLYIFDFHFGFSPAAKTFKVLKIAFKPSDCRTGECEIFTVGVDDKWRRLPNPYITLPIRSDFVALDGIFHWICIDKGPDFICTFDLGEEKIGQISVPPSLLLVSKPVHMAVLGKQLCLVDSSAQSKVSIWTLERNPVGESWTKIFTFWLTSEAYTPYLIPDAAVQRRNILFYCGPDFLISYNVEQTRWSKINFKTLGGFPSAYLLGYTPSFYLPAGIVMEKEQDLLLHSDGIMEERQQSTANV